MKQTPLVDPYFNLPSVQAIYAAIDDVILTSLGNQNNIEPSQTFPSNRSVPSHEANNFAETLVDNTIMGKISAMFGKLDGPDAKYNRPLFSTTVDNIEDEFRSEISAFEANHQSGTTPECIKNIWSISDKEARAVVDSNTELNRQQSDGLLSRHFSTNDRMLRYRRINSHFFTDTLLVTKPAKSLRGNLYLHVFVSNKGFIAVYPMELKSDFKYALHLFCK